MTELVRADSAAVAQLQRRLENRQRSQSRDVVEVNGSIYSWDNWAGDFKMHTPIVVFCSAGLLALVVTGEACANGVGENGSWQFRTAANRQILLAQETERQNLLHNLGVGSTSGLGTQTGNAVSVTIGGSNNNLSLNASNTGDQAISDNMLNN